MLKRRVYIAVSVALLSLVAACGSAQDPAPSATPSPTETAVPAAEAPASNATAVPAAALEPDSDRMLDWVRDLSVEIGPRVSGQATEKEAAEFIAEELRAFGYDVELQDFVVNNEARRESSLTVGGETITTVPFQGSGAAEVSGAFVSVPGTGLPADYTASARGSIVLVERGDLLFHQKIENARAAGAVGIVIYNNESGIFYGSVGEGEAALPAVAVSQADGQRLRDLLQRGGGSASLSVSVVPQATSYNVVAKPPGRECETVSGGHYDSVAQAPGANDNASGTATVMEIANVVASNGRMGSNCFVLFGSEETGLHGSRAYVNSLDRTERDRLKAMFNYDMVAVGSTWQLIGSTALQDRAMDLANSIGVPMTKAGGAPTGASSDHASFLQAGIPALFLYRTNDPNWHQPTDTIDKLDGASLETAARLGVALLESMGTSGS